MTEQPDLQTYLAQLQADAPATRATAVHAIGQLRDPAAINALVWLMGDDSLWVRCTAAEALGEFHSPAVVEPLVQFLKLGTDAELQRTGLPDETPVRFHRFTRQRDPDYEQWQAERGIQLPHDGFSLAVSARLGLQMTGINATEVLVSLLQDANPYTQYAAVKLLNQMAIRKRPSDALRLALMEDDDLLRLNAARALGKLGNFRAVRVLSSVLAQDERDDVRAAAAEALGKIRDPRAIPALQAALDDDAAHLAAWTALNELQINSADEANNEE